MPNFREECSITLEPFTSEYSRICDDLNMNESKKLYELITHKLIETLPEEVKRRPYKLTERMIQNILTSTCKNTTKSSRESASLSLHRIIDLLKKHGLLAGKVMITRRLRPEEVAIHDSPAFSLLDDFIEVRNWLCKRIKKVPRNRKQLPELVIASLISVNGITVPNAHLRISSCRPHHLKNSLVYQTLDIPTAKFSSNYPPTSCFPLLPEIGNLINHLKSTDQWLFPKSFNADTWGHRKRRTEIMNKYLLLIWEKVIGRDRNAPAAWNIRTFIICSRLYMALNSSPIVVGYLSGRTAFAALGVSEHHQEAGKISPAHDREWNQNEVNHSETKSLLAKELINAVREQLNQYHHKKQSKGVKEAAAIRLLGMTAIYYDILKEFPCLKHLINWVIWELNGDGKKRKMGTFRNLWQHIPLPLIEELTHADPIALDQSQWVQLAEYIIQENTYSPATRSKIKQHLKAFHKYLISTQNDVASINWRRGELKVYAESGSGIFPTLMEFDLLFEEAEKESNLKMRALLQGALVLAFFGGLRAEEITLLSKMDLDKVTIQIRVWWSKTRKGRRRLPLYLLTPRKYLAPIMFLHKGCSNSQRLIFQDDNGESILPDTLGKKIKKLMNNALPKERSMSIHTLRHGFASWLLIRYFVLHEPELLQATYANGVPIIPDSNHEIFSDTEQKKLVRVFNGRSAGDMFELNLGFFLSKPEHFAYISKLIGHASRGTTARTYVHSMEWIAYYYISKLSTSTN